MVTYKKSDIIPLADFEFAWRINDAKWPSLPKDVLHHITPLTDGKSKEVIAKSPLSAQNGYAFDPDRFHAVCQTSLGEDTAAANEWLAKLPIAPTDKVYVCWAVGDGVAMATDWRIVKDAWDDLWYPFDRMCVFDDTLAWGLMLGPEEHAVFIEAGGVDPQLPKSDPAYGLDLIRTP